MTAPENVEWWQHVGFASRPANPEKGKFAAQAFVVGNLTPGETYIYALRFLSTGK